MKKILALLTLLATILSACGPAALPPTPTAAPLPATQPPQAIIAPVDDAARQPTPTPPTPDPPAPTVTPNMPPTPLSGGGYPPAVSAARKDLAQRLGLPEDGLLPTSIIPIDWSDSCLGVAAPGEMCAEVITPGFDITFVVGAAQYIYHTNLDGKSLRRVGKPSPAMSGEVVRTALKWQNTVCDAFSVSTQAAFFGKCNGEMLAVTGPHPGLLEQAIQWTQEFAPFKAKTSAGTLELNGFGQTVATSAQQRMMAEWAQRQFEIARAEHPNAAWGLAFSYARSGGIAGFCDTVGLYRDGMVLVEDCKGTRATLFLTASQLETFYGWLDSLKRFEYAYQDPAMADAMSTTLTFEGQGQQDTDEPSTRAILEFCAELAAQGRFSQQVGNEFFSAKDTLLNFFTALHSGDTIRAAKLYGGDTSMLQTWNPDIQNDLPEWLERACTQNGLQCLLPRSVTARGPDARGGYQFFVEFNNTDGTLFRQGPCCGDTSGASTTVFLFAVINVGVDWQVMDLPPYVP
jgi:hypothetical protein